MEKTMSVCPSCSALNNVNVEEALSKKAKCGKCGSDLKMHSLVSEVSGYDMQRILRKTDKPVIVDFWASWCGPCQMYAPEFEKASVENPHAIFLKVSTEVDPHIGQQYGIRGIPATIVFKNGSEVRRQAGAMSAQQVGQLI